MKSFLNQVRTYLKITFDSIAFYPSLFALIATGLGIYLTLSDFSDVSDYLYKNLPWLVIREIETVRTILSTLIGGGISILVFTFNMVMLLLSQAANNYSPRVLPGLVSNRKHQVILGVFITVIIYNLVVLINTEPLQQSDQIPQVAALLGVVIALIGIGCFIYFIHSISTSIQINNILKGIFTLSRKRLQHLVKDDITSADFPDTSQWYDCALTKSGSVQNINLVSLEKTAQNYDTRMEILIVKGQFQLEGLPVLRTEKKLDKHQKKTLRSYFYLSETEKVSDNYILGFKQITEIGVKAMSPGINDPGTAITTIDYLTDLLSLRMSKQDHTILCDSDDVARIKLKMVSFKELFYQILASYRQYCKSDISVLQKLMMMCSLLCKRQNITEEYRQVILQQSELIMQDARKNIENPTDLRVLENLNQSLRCK